MNQLRSCEAECLKRMYIFRPTIIVWVIYKIYEEDL